MLLNITQKTCNICGKTKSITEFPENKNCTRDGHLRRCRDCHSRIGREGYSKEKAHEAYMKNAEKNRENARNRKREKIEKLGRVALDRFCQINKAYVERNREKVRKASAESYARADKKKLAAKQRESNKKLYHRDIEKSRAKVRLKANRRRHAPGDGYTLEQENQLLSDYGNRCVYCNKKIDDRRYMTLDHVVALSRGGENSIENLVPACLSCNSSKRNKPLLVWLLKKLNKK
jgi:5-methylcytosine-specific restriction endonuclease McrA